jgi:hypothetical protein
MKLIDKSTLVAEIRNKVDSYKDGGIISIGVLKQHCEDFIDFLNTFEVKEVDLDEYARHYLLHEHISPLNEVLHQADLKVEMQYHKDIENAYKAGFKFGLQAQKGE